ncbi:hypothetical protein G9A89_006995 [Geosiphon pyriformis]|nr:hypothetical protein G9A89_006995 [Geosiphon pyriformis]
MFRLPQFLSQKVPLPLLTSTISLSTVLSLFVNSRRFNTKASPLYNEKPQIGDAGKAPSVYESILKAVPIWDKNNESAAWKQEEKLHHIFLEPEKIPPKHNIVVCELEFRSYTTGPMDFYIDFSRRAAYALGICCSGPDYLPTKIVRWTVIRGPFIHKKTQENFERKTHRRSIRLRDVNQSVVDRWLYYVTQNVPAGIGLKVKMWEWEEIGLGKRMLEKAKGKQRKRLKDVENKNPPGSVADIAERLVEVVENQSLSENEPFNLKTLDSTENGEPNTLDTSQNMKPKTLDPNEIMVDKQKVVDLYVKSLEGKSDKGA